MAKAGLRPLACIYSTFLQRAFDQVFQEVVLQKLPVGFCMDRAGMVGGDGAVHHGYLDLAYLRSFQDMVLMAPADEPELAAGAAVGAEAGAAVGVALSARHGAGSARTMRPPFHLGKSRLLREGRTRPSWRTARGPRPRSRSGRAAGGRGASSSRSSTRVSASRSMRTWSRPRSRAAGRWSRSRSTRSMAGSAAAVLEDGQPAGPVDRADHATRLCGEVLRARFAQRTAGRGRRLTRSALPARFAARWCRSARRRRTPSV
jgi:hypothetical protein